MTDSRKHLEKLVESNEFLKCVRDLARYWWMPTQKADAVASLGAFLSTIVDHSVAAEARQVAFQDARRIASPYPSSEPIVDLPDERTWIRMVRDEYPTPIAEPYTRLHNSDDPLESFMALLDTFEALERLIALMFTGQRMRSHEGENKTLDRVLSTALFGHKPLSVGDWDAIVRDGARHFASDPDSFIEPSIVRALAPREGLSSLYHTLHSFVSMRNRNMAHRLGRAPHVYEDLLPRAREDLDRVLWQLRVLSGPRLVRPMLIDQQCCITRLWLYSGVTPMKLKEPSEPPLIVCDRDCGPDGDVRIDSSLIWVSSADPSRYLPIFPFGAVLVPNLNSPRKAFYFFAAAVWKDNHLHSASFDSPCSNDGVVVLRTTDGSGESLSLMQRLESHAKRLAGVMNDKPPNSDINSQKESLAERYILRQVLEEKRASLKLFVGRATWISKLVDSPSYTVLVGAPGMGKSALMAALHESLSGRAVLHMVKNGREPFTFLRSLLAQASQVGEAVGLLPLGEGHYQSDSLEGLTSNLMVRLSQIGNRVDNTVFCIIDGLDELGTDYPDLTFLPTCIPSNVRFVLSCRPEIPLLVAIRSRLVQRIELELKDGLDEEEIAKVLQVAFEEEGLPGQWSKKIDASTVARVTGGNPLYVRYVRDELIARAHQAQLQNGQPDFSVTKRQVDYDWHEALVRRLSLRDDTGAQRIDRKIRERLLLALAVTHNRAAIGPGELQGVLHASGIDVDHEDVLTHLDSISSVLIFDDFRRTQLFHSRLAEHIEQRQSVEGLCQVHGWFTEWLHRGDGGLDRVGRWSKYGLGHKAWHLIKASDLENANALLIDFGYLMARVKVIGGTAVTEILRDMRLLNTRLELDHGANPELSQWLRFLQIHAHQIIRGGASTLLQIAVGEADTSPVTRAAEAWLAREQYHSSWLSRAYRPKELRQSPCLRTFEGHIDNVTSVALDLVNRVMVSGSYDNTLRSWEIETGMPLLTFSGHTAGVTSVAVDSNNEWAISASRDHTLRLWSLQTGECLKVLEGHSDWIWGVSFLPDGVHAISASKDTTLKLWQVRTGKCEHTFHGHTGSVNAVAVDSNGTHMLSCSRDGTIKLWEILSGRCLMTLSGHLSGVNSIAFGRNDTLVVSASDDATLKIWDIETGACLNTLFGHVGSVWSVAVHSGASVILSAGDDRTVRVWDSGSGQCCGTLTGHADAVWSIMFDSNDRRALSASKDNTVKLWDLSTAGLNASQHAHSDWIHSLQVESDGRVAVAASKDHTLSVWNLETGGCLRKIHIHSNGINSVAIHPDGGRAVASGELGVLNVWDLKTCQRLRTLEGHTSQVTAITIHHDGCHVVSGGLDYAIKVWNLNTGKCVKTLVGHSAGITSILLHSDGCRAITASYDDTLRVWDLESGNCINTLAGHFHSVHAIALHPDGRRVISGSRDKSLKVWDIETGECVQTFSGHADLIFRVEIQPDGNSFLSFSDDETIRVWNLDSSMCVKVRTRHPGWMRSVILHPDGRHAFLNNDDRTLSVLDLAHGECTKILRGHLQEVTVIALHPDGYNLVSASDDHTLKVWDTSNGVCVRTLRGHTASVSSIAILPNGRKVVSGSRDNTLRIWDFDTGECDLILKGHNDWIRSILVDSEGQKVISSSDDGTLRIWSVKDGSCLQVLKGHLGPVLLSALSPLGNRIVSASDDATLKVWNAANGMCINTIQRNFGGIVPVVISLDGRHIISRYGEKTLMVWDIETGKPKGQWESDSFITACAITPGGTILVGDTAGGVLFLDWMGS